MVSVNNKAFTIIEAIIALFILLIVVLGLLYSLNLSINVNMQNTLRNHALRIAQSQTDEILNNAFNNIPVKTTYTKTIDTQVNNFVQHYTVNVVPTIEPQQEVILYTITVSWIYKGQTYYHAQNTAVHL
ncbi:hypothetical protein DESAMIL20_392 [Desulfurella amilsii]|uniref:Type IV fimbrial biogenesis protein PilV n=1 Tax=Desulfurella amilsii TaxID=1562698 RepID=A0A1X4XZ27_9BACT|nr:prepilin-type N-terminal cleavage/methylation domain-containing protein [Desulfurella amilsii]OSS42786.1 hypothetical protein DESAMIL20_392 [Desulfurella amilsii]